MVAAASPKQEAQERLFADAFIEAAEQLQQTTGTLQPYIGLETLIWQINDHPSAPAASSSAPAGYQQRRPEGWRPSSPTCATSRTPRQTWTWKLVIGCAVGMRRSSPSTGGPRRAVSRSPRRPAGISRAGRPRWRSFPGGSPTLPQIPGCGWSPGIPARGSPRYWAAWSPSRTRARHRSRQALQLIPARYRLPAALPRRCWQEARPPTSYSPSSQQVSASLLAQNSRTRSSRGRPSRW